MTDADGDFEVELPLGDYVAIISADGFVTATEEFTLDMAVRLKSTRSTSRKSMSSVRPRWARSSRPSSSPIRLHRGRHPLRGDFTLQSEVLFCEGIITDTEDCDEPTDAARVVHGGFDDYVAIRPSRSRILMMRCRNSVPS